MSNERARELFGIEGIIEIQCIVHGLLACSDPRRQFGD